jgi:translin
MNSRNVILKNVKKSLKEISKTLETSQEAREFLIKNTRNIIINCSQAIIDIHGGNLRQAKRKLKNASKQLLSYKKKANGDLERFIITPEQEFVEARVLLSIVEKKQISSYKALQVSTVSYVLGLLDCIGELKRLVLDNIREGKSKEAQRIFSIMESLYLNLYPLAIYDKILKEGRKKLDVDRILLEDCRAALTEEIRRKKLMDTINNIKK